MGELRSLGRELLHLASRRQLRQEHSQALLACASTLLHGVAPNESKIFAAVSALRACGPLTSNLEERLLALLARPADRNGPDEIARAA